MTEDEWLDASDPTPMFEHLRGKASERKLRLFACACCRLVWNVLVDERSRLAVETAERFADGLVSDGEAQAAFAAACKASLEVRGGPLPGEMLLLRRHHDPDELWRGAFTAAFTVGHGAGNIQSHVRAAEVRLVDGVTRSRLLRDLFGNPFRPISIDPTWLTWKDGAVVKVARAIYEERIYDRLPLLADALENAGCHDMNILSHCWEIGPHVQGCWVIDLLLGKE